MRTTHPPRRRTSRIAGMSLNMSLLRNACAASFSTENRTSLAWIAPITYGLGQAGHASLARVVLHHRDRRLDHPPDRDRDLLSNPPKGPAAPDHTAFVDVISKPNPWLNKGF